MWSGVWRTPALALARFDLARALRRRDPASPDARELATRARASLERLGPGWRRDVARIDAWLRAPSPVEGDP